MCVWNYLYPFIWYDRYDQCIRISLSRLSHSIGFASASVRTMEKLDSLCGLVRQYSASTTYVFAWSEIYVRGLWVLLVIAIPVALIFNQRPMVLAWENWHFYLMQVGDVIQADQNFLSANDPGIHDWACHPRFPKSGVFEAGISSLLQYWKYSWPGPKLNASSCFQKLTSD